MRMICIDLYHLLFADLSTFNLAPSSGQNVELSYDQISEKTNNIPFSLLEFSL